MQKKKWTGKICSKNVGKRNFSLRKIHTTPPKVINGGPLYAGLWNTSDLEARILFSLYILFSAILSFWN